MGHTCNFARMEGEGRFSPVKCTHHMHTHPHTPTTSHLSVSGGAYLAQGSPVPNIFMKYYHGENLPSLLGCSSSRKKPGQRPGFKDFLG